MNANISKKEIRSNLEAALISEIEKMEGGESSKKIKRVVRKLSKRIAPKVKLDMKRKLRKTEKSRKAQKGKEMSGYLIETTEHVDNGHS